MSHLLDAWLDASRSGNLALAKSLEDASVTKYSGMTSGAQFAKDYVNKSASVTVMTVEEKAIPVPIRVTELTPSSIIPPAAFSPTIVLVGGEFGGGYGIPWTAGPGALMNESWPLGTMMFYVGNRLGISIGIYDAGRSLENLIISKHLRNVRIRVHTGITRAGDAGSQRREETPGTLPIPLNRQPLPVRPGDGPGNAVEEFQKFAEQFDEPYMRWAPDLSPSEKFIGNAKDLFRFFTPNDANPFSWFQ